MDMFLQYPKDVSCTLSMIAIFRQRVLTRINDFTPICRPDINISFGIIMNGCIEFTPQVK